jgi:FkbM family methyltransferase
MIQPFTIRRLKMGAFVLEGDNNFPHRAEAAGHFDIDGDKWKIAEAVGLKPGMIMIDAGAFVGDTAVVFSSYGCEVIGIEPFLDAAVCAWLNTRHLPNVRILNRATGNGEKVELVFECPGPNFGMRSVRVSENGEASLRIDELDLPRLDFLKIDVEGREIETLLGAKETIARCKPILFVEMYEDGLRRQGHTPGDLEATIKSLGYDLQMWGSPPRWDWLCRPAAAVPAVNPTPAPEFPGAAAEIRPGAEGFAQGGTPVDPASIPAQPPVDNAHVADGAEKFTPTAAELEAEKAQGSTAPETDAERAAREKEAEKRLLADRAAPPEISVE